MRIIFNKTLIPSSASFLNAAECKKDIFMPEFYFEYTINGQEYILNNYRHCMIFHKGETIVFNANREFETLEMSIATPGHIPLKTKKYPLDEHSQQRAVYKNSSLVNDMYNTDEAHKGVLEITVLDTDRMLIAGKFSFHAYNPVRKKVIDITKGRFCLEYLENN